MNSGGCFGCRAADVEIGRRHLLGALSAVVLGGLAGCGSDRPDGGVTTSPTPGDSDGPTIDADATTEADEGTADQGGSGGGPDTDEAGGGPTTTAELDLREANVTGVEVEGGDGSYRFSVTLYHDDDGEDGYADWWQVETTDGERLGRRELLHAHGTEPFTRSETIEVPEGVGCVVVRGHDQTHGYGGQAMLVNAQTGATVVVRQGSDRGPVDASRCP